LKKINDVNERFYIERYLKGTRRCSVQEWFFWRHWVIPL